jgi:signal peptide peptidase SppA
MMHSELDHLFGGGPLFVERRAFRAWVTASKMKAQALSSPQAVRDAVELHAQRDVRPQTIGEVAVIDVSGPITYKSSWLSMFFGLASIEDLQTQFRMAQADATVKTILFRVDSPGGVVDMMPEFADEVFQARGKGKKGIIAVADTTIASCAYWLASQADAIYVTQSSLVGAIGVFVEHEEISGMLAKAGITVTLIAHGAHKTDGNPYEPLSEAAKADLKASVDEVGDWFDSAVARGRKVSKATVLEKFGQGKVFRGKQAMALGLADQTGSFGQVLAGLTSPRRAAGVRALAEADQLRIHGVADGDGDQPVEPDDNGNCPDGYVLDGDLCYLIDTKKNAPADEGAKADHTDVGRDGGGKFSAQCACDAACACMKGASDLCGAKCMTCQPTCACLTRAQAAIDQAAIIAALIGDE